MIAHFLFDVDEPENARHALMQSTTGKGTASAVPIEHVPIDWRAKGATCYGRVGWWQLRRIGAFVHAAAHSARVRKLALSD